MADNFQQALGQRLLDISEAIKRLKRDFAQKEDLKLLDSKLSQNKLVLSETNKKIKELEINIKKTIGFANLLKQNSAQVSEIKLIHQKQDKIIADFEAFKKKTDSQINYTYNDLIAVFRKFKTTLLAKEKKDISHLEKVYKQFDLAYSAFKKQTEDFEVSTENRIDKIKTQVETELKNNFTAFKQEMISAVKELQEKETKDNKLLSNDMSKLKLEIETTMGKFQNTTENYLYNLDREIETYVKKLRAEMKATDIHSAKHSHVLEKRFSEIKTHLQANIKAQQKQINQINDLLVNEKTSISSSLKEFKTEFQSEFDHLSANLSNLNDVQIKLSKEDLMHHIDSVSENFHNAANTNFKQLSDDLLHSEAENDKLRSLLKKQDAKIKLLEDKLLKRIIKLEAKNKKK